MKRLLLFIVLVLGFAASSLNAQTKKVLLEEFTGSWCGWCPRGIWAIEQLEEQYPGKFIVASFHNGDPMITPAGDSIEAGKLLAAITGYPDGWLQRRVYGTKLSIDPTNWPDEVDALVNEASVADVTVTNVTFDPVTRVVSGTVNAKFNMDTTGDFRINMYITENNVSGPAGTTWDQHNYLTGNPTYADNPFFELPAVVPNYKHQHVVRAVLGSIAGVAGVIPATAVKGMTYSQTFTYTLPNDIKADDAHFIGLAFRYKKAASGASLKLNEILNVDEVKVTTLKGLAVPATSSKNYIMATRSGETSQDITLTNTSNAAAKVSLAIDDANSAMPSGWQASVSPASVDVPAGGTATATLKYTAPANAGYASVTIVAMPTADGFTGHQSMLVVNALSAGTKYVSYGSDGFMENHMGSTYTQDYAVLPLDAAVMEAYPANQFDVGIFPNINFFDYENLNGAPAAVVPTINALLNAGKKAFITSTFGLYYCFDPVAPYFSAMNTEAVQSLFVDKLGIEYSSLESRSSGNNPVTTQVTGYTGDVVGDGVTFNAAFYQTDVFTIAVDHTTTTKPVIYLDDDVSVLGGVRYDNGAGQRLVYLDLNFGLVPAASASKAQNLIVKSMNFLLGLNSVKTSDNASSFTASNYPNPAVNSTKFTYSITERTPVSLVVRDVMGREVANVVSNETQDMGTYEADMDCSELSSGTYFYTLTAGNETVTQVLNVVK